MVRAGRKLPVLRDPEHPRSRNECRDGVRPCPWVSCRYHLLLDVGDDGRLWVNHRWGRAALHNVRRALAAMTETCALDVADMGGVSSARVAEVLALQHDVIDDVIRRLGEELEHKREDFDEREHPDDPYLRYMNLGADELAEIAAILKARQKRGNDDDTR